MSPSREAPTRAQSASAATTSDSLASTSRRSSGAALPSSSDAGRSGQRPSVRQARAISEQRLELLGLTTAYAEGIGQLRASRVHSPIERTVQERVHVLGPGRGGVTGECCECSINLVTPRDHLRHGRAHQGQGAAVRRPTDLFAPALALEELEQGRDAGDGAGGIGHQ